MLRDIETVAKESRLHLAPRGGTWTYDEDWPHIARFQYNLALGSEDGSRLRRSGTADGYRISQDWTVEDDLRIWDEADALDSDIVRYIEALIREVRACDETFGPAPLLTTAQRITILRHVEAVNGASSAKLTQAAAACLLMMDAPVFMLVDPWPAGSERRAPRGKLKGRSHIPALLDLGFVRMVGSRFLWRWNRELADTLMEEYSYEKLLSAKKKGALDEILKTPLSESVYGKLPKDLAQRVDLPDPEDLNE